jgi:hypothetical protein
LGKKKWKGDFQNPKLQMQLNHCLYIPSHKVWREHLVPGCYWGHLLWQL